MFTELMASGSGGGEVEYLEKTLTITSTPTPYTVNELAKITAIVYYYGEALYGFVLADSNGIALDYDLYNHQYGGITNVSANQFTFNWNNNVTFTFKIVGI